MKKNKLDYTEVLQLTYFLKSLKIKQYSKRHDVPKSQNKFLQ